MSLLICIATEFEGRLLRERLAGHDEIAIACTGVGPVNAAHGITLAIARQRPDAIVVCGVGGAYPGSALIVGDVVCADAECYGDQRAALALPMVPQWHSFAGRDKCRFLDPQCPTGPIRGLLSDGGQFLRGGNR